MNRVGTVALIDKNCNLSNRQKCSFLSVRQIAVYFLHVTYRLMNLKFLK